MIKKLLFVALSLFATTICAQETTTVPTIDDVTGDFIVMNYRSYNYVQSLAEMNHNSSPSAWKECLLSFFLNGINNLFY